MYWMSAIQVASLALLAQLLTPSFDYVSNPALDSSLCIAAAPRLRLLQLLLSNCIDPLQLLFPVASASTAAPRLHPLQLLLAICVHFSCCSPIVSASTAPPIASTSAAAPQLRHFNCCSPIASASAAARYLRLLQLLLPDCVCFNCCSLNVSASAAAPRLCPFRMLLPDYIRL